MEREENVYEDCGLAHTAEAEEKEGAAILQKFKDVNALAEAYSALQAEFTRRSQRLRALEKAMDNFGQAEAAENAREGGAETVQTVQTVQTGLPQSLAPQEGERGTIDPEPPKSAKPVACNVPTYEEREFVNSDRLYEAAKENEGVRLKIIGDYLSSLKSSGAPVMTGGTGSPAVSLKKPKSLREAGQMALSYFKGKA